MPISVTSDTIGPRQRTSAEGSDVCEGCFRTRIPAGWTTLKYSIGVLGAVSPSESGPSNTMGCSAPCWPVGLPLAERQPGNQLTFAMVKDRTPTRGWDYGLQVFAELLL